MTPRLTAPQMAVLRALDALPEGEWTTAKDGGFSGGAAANLAFPGKGLKGLVSAKWNSRLDCYAYGLTIMGRALVAQLKAEGKL